MIHLDTNAMIALLNNTPRRVREQFGESQAAGVKMAISTIVHYELMYGAADSRRRAENEDKIASMLLASAISVIPFEAADATHAADIRVYLKRIGLPIGPYDVLIAGQARRHGATLVTSNLGEFKRVPGLIVMDWAA
jgi:tRNA(fMet)-specific endonuclease VapC